MVKGAKKMVDSNGVPKKKKMTAREREELLIENFIGLQRAMINLSMKFENLSDNIAKLLNVFEVSARDYMVNKGRTSPEVDRDLVNRINMLIEQNKAIMSTVRSIEEKSKQKPEASKAPVQMVSPQQTQVPSTNIPQGMQQSQYNPSTAPAKPKTIVQTI
ncbi:MAG: hypothetical protein WCI72_00045 [archaeon]